MATFKIAKVLMKSLFDKPATLMYPVVQREWQERTRGSIDIEAESCILCGICSKRCPTNAIETYRTTGLWTIHRMQCIQCGECAAACPKKCLSMNQKYTEPQPEKVVDSVEIPIKKAAGGAADGDLTCNKEACVFCGLCVKACPADAIKVDRKAKTWEVDKDACAKCGACVEKCPKKCLSMGGNATGAAAPADDAKLECNTDVCSYCGFCATNCPADALTVDRKEKVWKVDDDACAKCGICVEKCPKKCLTLGDIVPEPDRTEGKEIACDESACVYCGLCAKNCPADALKVDRKEKSWVIDKDACVKCEICVEKCPKKCLQLAAPGEAVEAAPATGAAAKSLPVVDTEKCVYCAACESECPEGAIEAPVDAWKVDEEKCIGCGACTDVCPTDALTMK